MRLNHVTYWVNSIAEAVKFFCETMFYKIDPNYQHGFDMQFNDNTTAKCFVLIPYERISNSLNQKEYFKINAWRSAEYHIAHDIFVMCGSKKSTIDSWIKENGPGMAASAQNGPKIAF